jgi:outer membrane protein insertion porin family
VLEVGLKGGVVEAFSSFGEEPPAYHSYTTIHPITGEPIFHRGPRNLRRNDVPFFERYFLGGAYSLRGFRYRDVSPQEAGIRGVGLEPVGGNSYYLAYSEYSLPIIDRVRVAAFADMGNVYYNSYQFKLDQFNADVGLGLRLNLPIGPLRFDYGIPIHDSNNLSGGGRFNFTVGYQREF